MECKQQEQQQEQQHPEATITDRRRRRSGGWTTIVTRKVWASSVPFVEPVMVARSQAGSAWGVDDGAIGVSVVPKSLLREAILQAHTAQPSRCRFHWPR